jgi:hypothetical protein
MKRIFTLFILSMTFWFLLSETAVFAQEKEEGKLADFEKKVDKEENADTKSEESEDEEAEGGETSEFAESLVSSPGFWDFSFGVVYGLFINFPGEDSLLYFGDYGNCYFSQYPYMSSGEGIFSQEIGKRFSISLSGHYFYDESDLTGYGFRARLSPHPFVNAEIHFSDLTEKLDTRDDHLKLYNVFVNYNRLRLERFAFWWGLGLKGLQGDKTYNGFAFNIGTEIYPARPISLSLNYSGGFINDTYVPDFFGSLNLHLYRFAIFAGYQYWSAGSAKIDGITGGIKLFF